MKFHIQLTICKFFKFPNPGGSCSNSLSPKYKARSVSANIDLISIAKFTTNRCFSRKLPIMKKFPGNAFSSKLLYDKSSTSKTGKAPKPRGNELRRFIDRFRIRNFGIDESETGSSSMWLLVKFNISKFVKLAMPGGIATFQKCTYNYLSNFTVFFLVGNTLTCNAIVTQCHSCHIQHIH